MVRALEGVEEEELVEALLDLRNAVSSGEEIASSAVTGTRDRLVNLVNNFFHEKLSAMPEIREYMAGFEGD